MSKPVFFKSLQLPFLLAFVLSSCSLSKRHYRPGYYVHAFKSQRAKASKPGREQDVPLKDSTGPEKEIMAEEFTGRIIPPDSLQRAYTMSPALKYKREMHRSQQDAELACRAYQPGIDLHPERITGDQHTRQAEKTHNQFRNKKKKTHMTDFKNSKRNVAIIIGIALLLMALVAAFSAPIVSGIFVSGNPALTALNLSAGFGKLTGSIVGWVIILALDLLVSAGVYAYYKKEKPKVAFSSAVLRLIYSIFLGAAICQLLKITLATPAPAVYNHLHAFNSIWGWGLIAFGLHLISLGILFKNEGGKTWLTITIKVLLILAGTGYLVVYVGMLIAPSPMAFKAAIEPIFLLPMILGEVFFALWMLIKGGK